MNGIIRYKMDDAWVTGTILGQAGKTTGKYTTWYNVRNEDNEERSVDLKTILWEKMPKTKINIAATTESKKSESKEVSIAEEIELENLVLFDIYAEVTDCSQKTFSMRWV